MKKINVIGEGFVEVPFDEEKPFIEVSDEQLSQIRNGVLKYRDGKLVDISEELNAKKCIAELKKLLSDSDFKVIKHSEGEISDLDYEPIKQQRKSWREEIRALEAQYGN